MLLVVSLRPLPPPSPPTAPPPPLLPQSRVLFQCIISFDQLPNEKNKADVLYSWFSRDVRKKLNIKRVRVIFKHMSVVQ